MLTKWVPQWNRETDRRWIDCVDEDFSRMGGVEEFEDWGRMARGEEPQSVVRVLLRRPNPTPGLVP